MNAVDNTNKHFKGQLPTEEVEAFCRKHWSVLMKDILGFFLFIGILALTVSQLKGVYKYFVQESTLRAFLALAIVGIFTIYIHKFFLKIRMLNQTHKAYQLPCYPVYFFSDQSF